MSTHSFTSRLLRLAVPGVLALFLTAGCSPEQFVMLDPAGPVAQTQLRLIIISAILVLIVVIPVILLLAYIVYRYRDKPDNDASYEPEWSESPKLEAVWWGIPIVIIAALGVVTAKETFALTRPPVSNAKPMTIEVVSLDWKWLFLYPDQHIATVNEVHIPVGTPVQFVLTSDAPMNSFWVPQLGGQEYTMPGMAMGLWLQADQAGDYLGRGANFTGTGFAHNTFHVIAQPSDAFNGWVQQVQSENHPLTVEVYDQLAKPGLAQTMTFSSFPDTLFHDVVQKNGGMSMPMNEEAWTSGRTSSASSSGQGMSGMDMNH
ncbi:MAG: COX aromatic rich motif-containing protein [Thermoflavifilum sp.]|nr:COX aromatic rich motif-containing protein [Thermoflavifilum sp.]MCL6512866.1 COX aromatic rich motif-containing protein [Alicyclobacillus sp.]